MNAFTNNVNFIAAFVSLVIGVIAVITIILHAINRKRPHPALDELTKWVLWCGLIVSVAAVLGSLTYSGIIGYPPCELCWWQRVMIYPQVILYAVALFNRERTVFRYLLALSLVGIIISIYQNYLIWGGSALIACDVSNPCTAVYVNEFGFVTIPFMSLLTLLGLTAISWIGLERNPN